MLEPQQPKQVVTEAKVIQVIRTIVTRGAGTEEDPARFVRQYWSLKGDLLAEFDPVAAEKQNRPEGWSGGKEVRR